MSIIIGEELFEKLLQQASENPRRRTNLDLRNNDTDTSQRMLNALLPATKIPVHRHLHTSETVVVLKGSLDELLLDDEGNITERIPLAAGGSNMGIQVPCGCWHTIDVHEPSVIIEFKDGSYAPLSPDEIMHKEKPHLPLSI